MFLTNRQIITEADTLVPNAYEITDKIPWLNALNQEFFDVVKIPSTLLFASVAGQNIYTLIASNAATETTGTNREKNIDKVMVGNLKYLSLNYDDVQPGQNWFTFNGSSGRLTLSPAPSRSGLSGIVRRFESAATNFTVAGVEAQTPDAPIECHWIYVLGLAEYIAKANEEDEKAANYGGQYRAALQVAAQNFQKAGAT